LRLSFLSVLLLSASNQGGSRKLLEDFRGKRKAPKNNQAAQAIEQSKRFGGGINQAQAGERDTNPSRDNLPKLPLDNFLG
jgi:hypothetical protein